MDNEFDVLPPNHPLSVYLRELNLIDEEVCFSKTRFEADEIPVPQVTQPSRLAQLWQNASVLFSRLIIYPNIRLLTWLLKSDSLLSSDRNHIKAFASRLLEEDPPPLQSFSLIALPVFLFLTAVLVQNSALILPTSSCILAFAALRFLLPILHMLMVKWTVRESEGVFSLLVESSRLLRGLTGVEMGFIFAEKAGLGKNQLNKVVLPRYTASLHQLACTYAERLLSISHYVNSIIDSSLSLVSQLPLITDFHGHLPDSIEEELKNESNLRNVKALMENIYAVNSSLTRVFMCYFSLRSGKSTLTSCNFFEIMLLLDYRLGKIMWALHQWIMLQCRARRRLFELEKIRINLLRGQVPDGGFLYAKRTSSHPSDDEVRSNKLLSALNSLHYNVIAWSCRIQKMLGEVASVDQPTEQIGKDLDSMRLLLTNCQICLDEAYRVLRQDSTEPKEQLPCYFEPKPVEDLGELIPLDGELPLIEDECLEAVVGDGDIGSEDAESAIDDFDDLGKPISASEKKKRNEEKAILLTELNSVISHRLIETRKREERALSRFHGVVESSEPSQSTSPEANQDVPKPDGEAVEKGVAGTPRKVDLKLRMQLRGQHFHRMVEKLDSETEDSKIVGDSTPTEIETAVEPPRPPVISEDLKTMIFQQRQFLKPSSTEETFEDFGTGEEAVIVTEEIDPEQEE